MNPQDYMVQVLKKALIDVKAKEFEYCTGGLQITLNLNRDEIVWLLQQLGETE